jgi:prepilin-type N-terminal cleavage/methylation domain-containing protein
MFNIKQKQGFTLVELIIVVAIIAVLASLAFMALSGETSQARDSKRVSDLKVFEDSLSTSNGKNKTINYEKDNVGKNHLGDPRIDDNGTVDIVEGPNTHTLETNAGILKSIRGAYLLPIIDGIFDSDVLPTAARDPKGSYYLAAFLSNTDYSFYGTKENPETKIATAIVRGSFKEGAILDTLMKNLGGLDTNIELSVANPNRFVRGDIIKIDDEYMVVRGYDPDNSILEVTRGYDPDDNSGSDPDSIKVHNKGASIKLMNSANGGDSLVCLGIAANADDLIGAPDEASINDDFVSGFSLTAASASMITGDVCSNSDPVVDEGHILPYRIN